MIVNAEPTFYVIVELTKEDLRKIADGADVCCQTYAERDTNTLVRVYCSEPCPGFNERLCGSKSESVQ